MADAAGKIYRTAIEASSGGESIVNVLYFKGRGDTDDAAALALEVELGLVPMLAAAQCSTVQYSKVTCVEVNRLGASDAAERSLGGHAGAVAEEGEAPQLAVCMNLRTGEAGRTRRGRFFLSGVSDAWTHGGRVTGDNIIRLNTLVAAMTPRYVGATFGSDFQLGVFSRKRYELLSNPFDEAWVPVRQLSYKTVLSTMRSRKPSI